MAKSPQRESRNVASQKPGEKISRRLQIVVSGAAKQFDEKRDGGDLWISPRKLLLTLS